MTCECRPARHLQRRWVATSSIVGLAAGLFGVVGQVTAQGTEAAVCSVQLPATMQVTAAVTGDLNADGRRDLVIAAASEGLDYARVLRVHWATEQRAWFKNEPDATLDLPPDVVAFAVADVHAAAGSEVVLLSGTQAVAWRPGVPAGEAFTRLAQGECLWQVPHPERVLLWDAGVVDANRDGLDDLLLPRARGHRLLVQQRTNAQCAFVAHDLDVPGEELIEGQGKRISRSGARIEISFGGQTLVQGPFLALDESVPAAAWRDFDGDGDLDLLALTRLHCLVWLQDGGVWPRDPSLRLAVPGGAARDRDFDVTYRALAEDVDRDGRTDCLLFLGDYRGDEVRTQVLLFTQAGAVPLLGADAKPRQLLVLGGFAGGAELEDIDGDGAPELVVGALKTSFVETISARVSDRLEAELYVYRGQQGALARRPELVLPVTLHTDDLAAMKQRLTARFFADVNGDGVRDLCLRTDRERVDVRATRLQAGVLTVAAKPLWGMSVDPKARIGLIEGRSELLVNEPRQVVHVRLGAAAGGGR